MEDDKHHLVKVLVCYTVIEVCVDLHVAISLSIIEVLKSYNSSFNQAAVDLHMYVFGWFCAHNSNLLACTNKL